MRWFIEVVSATLLGLPVAAGDVADYLIAAMRGYGIELQQPATFQWQWKNGLVIGVGSPGTVLRLIETTDVDYTIAIAQADERGDFAFREAPVTKVFRIETIDGADAVGFGSDLLRSYRVPSTSEHYTVLKDRTFIYDQAVAVVAATNYSMPELLRWVRGLLSCFDDSGQFPFSVNSRSGIAIDPYYRTGAQMWGHYALLWYLQHVPETPLVDDIRATVRRGLDELERLYLAGNKGLQIGMFCGGAGRYAHDYSYFDQDYVVPWVSTEHNIDAYFVYDLAAQLFDDDHFAIVRDKVRDGLFRLWDEDRASAYQGTMPTAVDTSEALDCTSWYALFCLRAGDERKASLSIAAMSRYAVGYAPYLPSRGYPAAHATVWGEGTAGAVLAANRMFAAGVRYVNRPLTVYEMHDWPSLASTCWTLLTMRPNGFWQ